jgi:hypothetical protein
MKIRNIMALLILGVFISGCVTTPGNDVTTTNPTVKPTDQGAKPTIPIPQPTDAVKTPTTQPNVVPTTTVPTPETIAQDAAFEDYLIKYKQKRLFRGNYSVPDRAAYGISLKVFDLLPPVPNDFLYKVYLIKYGKFVNIADLGPEYYKQPEFDPDFTKFGLRYWNEWKEKNYTKKYWGTVGLRSYPFSQHVIAAPGYSFNVTVFLSSNWNIETYQGIHLTTKFISSAQTEDGKFISSAKDGEKYINVNVTPNEFLLTPAFPQFSENWVQKLTFTGKIADNAPKGTYILSMDTGKPGEVNSDKWLLEYLNLYSEGAETITTDKPYLQAFIYVQ